MPIPKETQWYIDEHTKAKHDILRRYLGAWFPILGSTHGRVLYVDGFSGPGRYRDGEPGSPLIALDVARTLNLEKPFAGELLFLFTDERQDRVGHLESELEHLDLPASFEVRAEVGRFDEIFAPVLDGLEAKGQRLAPAFVFIDPFGFSGVPFSLVARILQNPRCEVFITFMVNAVQRFIEHPVESIRDEIVGLFGTELVLEVVSGTGNRIEALRSFYQQRLELEAEFVRSFEIRDTPGRVLYHLFFASNHRLGHAKMKDAMWEVDRTGGLRFVDNTDVDQLVLLDEDPAEKLVKVLSAVFAGDKALGHGVRRYVMDKTAFVNKHATKALQLLEARGAIRVADTKKWGGKRRKGSFPDDAVITFD